MSQRDFVRYYAADAPKRSLSVSLASQPITEIAGDVANHRLHFTSC
jgi:hypothetical protein